MEDTKTTIIEQTEESEESEYIPPRPVPAQFPVFEHRGQIVSSSLSLALFFGVAAALIADKVQAIARQLPGFYTAQGEREPARVAFQRNTDVTWIETPIWNVNAEGFALLMPFLEAHCQQNPQDRLERCCAVLQAYREAEEKRQLQTTLLDFAEKMQSGKVSTGDNLRDFALFKRLGDVCAARRRLACERWTQEADFSEAAYLTDYKTMLASMGLSDKLVEVKG